jgi:hypothetical protein
MKSETLRKNLESESGPLCWQELEKHFARGAVRVISSNANLIDIAINIAENNIEQISDALASKTVTEATDSQAKQWQQLNSSFQCVVVAPFVLIQENKT